MLDWIKDFNSKYASAVSAMTPFIIGFVSWVYYKIYQESKLKEGDAATIVNPTFWALGKKYKVLAVHKYELSNDPSGYKHLSQNSRNDLWEKLIAIDTTLMGLRHSIVPFDDKDILDVIISRNGKEKWKVISFNK